MSRPTKAQLSAKHSTTLQMHREIVAELEEQVAELKLQIVRMAAQHEAEATQLTLAHHRKESCLSSELQVYKRENAYLRGEDVARPSFLRAAYQWVGGRNA